MTAIVEKFRGTGSVQDLPRSGRPTTATSVEKLEEVKDFVETCPETSVRRGSVELGMSQASYYRSLKKLHLKTYLPQFVVELSEDDFDRRAEFCETWLSKFEENPQLVNKIVWSDEAEFKLNGRINRHNCSYWAKENPHVQLPVKHSNAGVMVWCGLTSNGLLGPFFFEENVNGASYRDMLEQFLWPQVKHRGLYFQQDGAPAHYSLTARTWLDKKFPGRWIGRRGPFEWPARSPDLSPCDFFLWGHLKNLVYREHPSTVEELRNKIAEACVEITQEMCSHVCESMPDRLQACLAIDGKQLKS